MFAHYCCDDNHFETMWASPLNPQVLEQGADEWLGACGIEKKSDQWHALLVYSSESIELYRPTILEAGWYAFHFPSPPDLPIDQGGIALDSTNLYDFSNSFPWEFIHRRIELSSAKLHKISVTTSASECCEKLRRRHHGRLVNAFGAETMSWMSNPI